MTTTIPIHLDIPLEFLTGDDDMGISLKELQRMKLSISGTVNLTATVTGAFDPAINYFRNPEDFGNATWEKFGVTSTPEVPPSTTEIAIAAGSATRAFFDRAPITGGVANKKFGVAFEVRSATGADQTFRLTATHSGVADYNSPDFVATAQWQEFYFEQQFGASAGDGRVLGGIRASSAGLAATIDVRNPRLGEIA